MTILEPIHLFHYLKKFKLKKGSALIFDNLDKITIHIIYLFIKDHLL